MEKINSKMPQRPSEDGDQSPTSTIHKRRRRVKRKKKQDDLSPSESFNIPGVSKITISPKTQKILECFVGEHVTTEKPWKYVAKEAFEDDSEFSTIRKELESFPRMEVLLGYVADGNTDHDEFYICLTEGAQEKVSGIVEKLQQRQNEKLHNTIWKSPQPWKSLGSEEEVDGMLHVNNRSLMAVELETSYPIFSNRRHFRLNLVDDRRDGYVEFTSLNADCYQLIRTKIDGVAQATSSVLNNESQTIFKYPKNNWTQYEFTQEEINWENVKIAFPQQDEKISDLMQVNSAINFYTNDYGDLIKDSKYTQIPKVATIKEFTSFFDETLTKSKQITSVSWHPMWTGIVAIAYSHVSPNTYLTHKRDEDEVLNTIYGITPVLLWSFTNPLTPILSLESPRTVLVLSFCPYNSNILVGGCASGQILVWDLKNKIQTVETNHQNSFREKMFARIKWMKYAQDTKVVKPTVISDLEYSHGDDVTGVEWCPPFRQFDKNGRLHEIPESENRESVQFITCSRDGCVLIWDLVVAVPAISIKPKTFRRLLKTPSALIVEPSPLHSLNRILKPIFKISVMEPNTIRTLPLSSLGYERTFVDYVEQEANSNRKFNITERTFFKPIVTRPEDGSVAKMVAGSAEGDFITFTWNSGDYDPDEILNKEVAKTENFSKYHDGPVVSISRTEKFPDLTLTTGGKVFAIWKSDLVGKPVLWRRGKFRYTHGKWNSLLPNIFRLTREDGCIEMWHLRARSDSYSELAQISDKALTGAYSHPRLLKRNVIGIADGRGCFQMWYVAFNLSQYTEEDTFSTLRLCEREIIRKKAFAKWQNDWIKKHEELIKEKKKKELLARKKQEDDLRRLEKEKLEISRSTKASKPEIVVTPAERAHQKWTAKEAKRMNKILLEKKFLNVDVLHAQQLPLTTQREHESKKRLKQEERLMSAQKIYVDTVAKIFPDVIEKKASPATEPYETTPSTQDKASHFENYEAIAREAQEYVRQHDYIYSFDWLAFVKAGQERRAVLDGCSIRRNHRDRVVQEKNRTDAKEELETSKEAIIT